MPEERPKQKDKKKKGLRLFIALYPPAELAEQLIAQLSELDLPDHRPTPAEQIHMTVQFLGDRATHELHEVIESIQRPTSGIESFGLRIERLINFPPKRPARMVAAETDAPASLRELHQRLVNRFANNPRPAPDRKFRPHMTLCRFARPKRGFALNEHLSLPAFTVSGISLMRSTLSPAGAQHDLVQRIDLE